MDVRGLHLLPTDVVLKAQGPKPEADPGGDDDMRASTMQTTVKMAAAAMVLTMGLAGAAQAQPRRGGLGFGPAGGPGFGGPGGQFGPLGGLLALNPELPLQALDLTDAQRDQVRAIMQSHREEGRAIGTKARAALEALHAATAANVDEAGAAQQAQALGAAIGEAAVLRARVRSEVFAVLTPEQQARVSALQQAREKRAEERRSRTEERRTRGEQRRQQRTPK